MDNAVDPGDHALDRGHIGDVGLVDLLATLVLGAGRRDRHPVRYPQHRIDAAQRLSQRPADATARAGDQHSLHPAFPPSVRQMMGYSLTECRAMAIVFDGSHRPGRDRRTLVAPERIVPGAYLVKTARSDAFFGFPYKKTQAVLSRDPTGVNHLLDEAARKINR